LVAIVSYSLYQQSSCLFGGNSKLSTKLYVLMHKSKWRSFPVITTTTIARKVAVKVVDRKVSTSGKEMIRAFRHEFTILCLDLDQINQQYKTTTQDGCIVSIPIVTYFLQEKIN